jgi:hypothetical protein
MNKNLKEFLFFLKSEAEVPKEVSGQILSAVHAQLSPSQSKLFSKIILIHLGVSLASLTVCPQFGFGSWLWKGHGLMGIFMEWGEVGCALGCGATFLGFSCLSLAWVLSTAEIKSLRRTGLFYVFILSALSLMGLMLLGGQTTPLFAIFWLFGAILGGLGLGVIGIKIRKYGTFSLGG